MREREWIYDHHHYHYHHHHHLHDYYQRHHHHNNCCQFSELNSIRLFRKWGLISMNMIWYVEAPQNTSNLGPQTTIGRQGHNISYGTIISLWSHVFYKLKNSLWFVCITSWEPSWWPDVTCRCQGQMLSIKKNMTGHLFHQLNKMI